MDPIILPLITAGISFLGVFVSLLAFVGSCVAIYFTRKTSFEVAALNSQFNKELKVHEYRLAYAQKIVQKRIEVYEDFFKLTDRFVYAQISEQNGIDDIALVPDLFEAYLLDVQNMLFKSYWLRWNTRIQFLIILDTTNKIVHNFNELRSNKIELLNKQIKLMREKKQIIEEEPTEITPKELQNLLKPMEIPMFNFNQQLHIDFPHLYNQEEFERDIQRQLPDDLYKNVSEQKDVDGHYGAFEPKD